jgi:DNA-binding MarR family transcriptional regulator
VASRDGKSADPFADHLAQSGLLDVFDSLSGEHGSETATFSVATAAVFRAQRVVFARVEEALAPLGLTTPRFEILGLLDVTVSGELPFGDLKQTMFMHPATMGHTIRQLESDGLVRRRVDPQDRRAFVAVITAKGRRLAARARAGLAAIHFGMVGLSEADARALCLSLACLDGSALTN